MVILGLSGSLRHGSFNHRLLLAAGVRLPAGATLDVFEGLADIEAYNEDAPASAAVERFRGAITAADALLFATPEYNASIPGQLKNALDWASRPFPDNALRGRPAAVVGASTGLFGAVWAQAELRKVLATIGAQVLDAELPVGLAHDAFDAQGMLIDAVLRARFEEVVSRLVAMGSTSTAMDATAPAAVRRCA